MTRLKLHWLCVQKTKKKKKRKETDKNPVLQGTMYVYIHTYIHLFFSLHPTFLHILRDYIHLFTDNHISEEEGYGPGFKALCDVLDVQRGQIQVSNLLLALPNCYIFVSVVLS